MSFGLDYVTGPPVADLKSGGVTFVCRYLSFVNNLTQVKLLTEAEAKALGAAGIAIVSNYEWYADRALEGFASGSADAHIAASQHANCGGPPNRPIYFSVDVDVAGSQVVDYFKGVASVIGLHRTGAYGSYRVLQELFNLGAITWGWQTYAWSYGQWEPRAHIQQYNNGMTMAGLSVDYNRSIKSDFGQWMYGEEPMAGVPQGWHDDGTTLTAPNGHKVVRGFRAKVLAGWDAQDIPLEEERQVAHVEQYYPSDAGAVQTFNFSRLCYTQARGVYKMGIGNELLGCEKALAACKATPGDATVQQELNAANQK